MKKLGNEGFLLFDGVLQWDFTFDLPLYFVLRCLQQSLYLVDLSSQKAILLLHDLNFVFENILLLFFILIFLLYRIKDLFFTLGSLLYNSESFFILLSFAFKFSFLFFYL